MATIIDRGLAQSLIQQFRKDNSAAGGPALVTPTKEFLNGFFVDIGSIRAILESNPNLAGIHVYLAKHPDFDGKADRVYTIMITGSEEAASGSATPYVSNGDVYDQTMPCPPICSNL